MVQNMCQWYHYPTLVLPSLPHERLYWYPWVHEVYQNITDYLLPIPLHYPPSEIVYTHMTNTV